ncbi:MAG TPA: hypothetical protein DDY78_12855 [Planctomycetales bacterium]|jgi:hypothetical protein|nr:hypothetical protein [Planctomycetales bacterium]
MRRTGLPAFLAITVPFYLALLWFTSCLSRRSGVLVFAIGVAGLLASLLALRWQRRSPLFGLYLLVVLAAVSGLGLEAVLRLCPAVLTGEVANAAYGGYHDLCGGIYNRDAHMALALRPNCRREIYWNGHWWRHETNAGGYRGPAVDQADAVFLGDSMIYGHGVENEDTVASRFAVRTGLPVANLGQQGTCPIQYWLRLRETGLGLRPRLVFVCCHFNDIDEAAYFYDAAELRRFVGRPVEQDEPPLANSTFQPRRWWSPEQFWNEHLALPLRIAGAGSGLIHAAKAPEPAVRPGRPMSRFVPDEQYVESPFAPWAEGEPESRRLGWQAYVRALEKIDCCCRRQGATMVLFDLGYPRAYSQATEAAARRIGVRYSPAGRLVLDRARAGEDTYLAHDGHWSAHGCDLVAAELVKEMNAAPPEARSLLSGE